MIKWSYSALKEFTNCPRQYNELRNLKKYTKKISQQMAYGKEVHKALEEYARDGKELPKFYRTYKDVVDAIKEIPGQKYYEHKMAIKLGGELCNFESPDYWVRGIADVISVGDSIAFLLDYKTGNNRYADVDQLTLMSLLIFLHFPDIQLVRGGLLFITRNSLITEDYHRKNQELYWKKFYPNLQRLTTSYESNNWPENPSGLCKFCPVKACNFWRG
jgi:PD-(D/E)XK nuclease superfamily